MEAYISPQAIQTAKDICAKMGSPRVVMFLSKVFDGRDGVHVYKSNGSSIYYTNEGYERLQKETKQ